MTSRRPAVATVKYDRGRRPTSLGGGHLGAADAFAGDQCPHRCRASSPAAGPGPHPGCGPAPRRERLGCGGHCRPRGRGRGRLRRRPQLGLGCAGVRQAAHRTSRWHPPDDRRVLWGLLLVRSRAARAMRLRRSARTLQPMRMCDPRASVVGSTDQSGRLPRGQPPCLEA